MSDKVLVDRELLAKATMLPSMKSLEENRRDIVERGRAQAEIRELLAAPPAQPDASVLVEALESLLRHAKKMGRTSALYDNARAALAAYRKQGDEQ